MSLDETLAKKMAAMIFTNATQKDIAAALNITPGQVSRYIGKPMVQDELAALANESSEQAVKMFGRETTALMRKAVRVLHQALDGSDQRLALQAATKVMEATGLLDRNKPQVQDTHIQIVMPTNIEPTDVVQMEPAYDQPQSSD